MPPNNRRKSNIAAIYKFHRYLGLVVALFLVWLSVSGIFLNHTEDLKLDQKHLQSKVINGLYGIKKLQLGKSFQFENNWIVQFGSEVILNQQVLITTSLPLLAALETEEYFIIGTSEQVTLFTKAGELIDNLKTPATLENMAWYSVTDDKQLVIKTSTGDYLANEDITEWTAFSFEKANIDKSSVQWSAKSQLPIENNKQLSNKYNGKGPTLEQVMLDTHSGRIFGKLGVYLADFIAAMTIILTLLGVYLWWRRIKR